jgi:hypothetical protein
MTNAKARRSVLLILRQVQDDNIWKFGNLEIWKFGGAVGVLPPESEKPDQRFLQAQLRN